MMESHSLNECREEITNQIMSLGNHDNVMKAALIASFILQNSIDVIRSIDPSKFLDSLRDTLNRQIECGEEWKHKGNMLREHLEKNKEVISAFERCEKDIEDLSARITHLLKEYDNLLKSLCLDRSRKSIAEIEAELQTLKNRQ